MTAWVHRPVLPEETLAWLRVRPGGRYLDATLGSGGHTRLILERLNGEGDVVGLDRDPEAIARVSDRLAGADNLHLRQANFATMVQAVDSLAWSGVDGIVMDLGCSSDQIDTPRRGFSFQQDGPLDMRMNPDGPVSAADWVNRTPEAEMARVIRRYGEDPAARRIARAVARRREKTPFSSTADLADVVGAAAGGRRSRIHPATRTFQAIRMAVNEELESLEAGLDQALRLLLPGGRLVVISFHSLEDRMVKQCFSRHIGRMESLHEGGARWVGETPRMTRLTRKPVTATETEISENPRARSAKLRAVEKDHGEAQGTFKNA